MRKPSIASVSLCLLPILGGGVNVVAAQGLSRLFRHVEDAATAKDLNDAYAALLYPSTVETLEQLKADNANGVALQAAWAEVKASAPAIPASIHHSRRTGMVRLAPVAIARFVGFLEGRLHTAAPGWWQDLLADARGRLDMETGLLLLHVTPAKRGFYYERGASENGCSVLTRGDVADARTNTEILTLSVGQHVVQVPCSERIHCYVSAKVLDSSQCIVLVHGGLPSAKLFRIDLANNKVKWENDVWCDFAPYVRSGGGFFHWAEVFVGESRVHVFGACNDVLYIEAFELEDGQAQFRFSTTYGWALCQRESQPE